MIIGEARDDTQHKQKLGKNLKDFFQERIKKDQEMIKMINQKLCGVTAGGPADMGSITDKGMGISTAEISFSVPAIEPVVPAAKAVDLISLETDPKCKKGHVMKKNFGKPLAYIHQPNESFATCEQCSKTLALNDIKSSGFFHCAKCEENECLSCSQSKNESPL